MPPGMQADSRRTTSCSPSSGTSRSSAVRGPASPTSRSRSRSSRSSPAASRPSTRLEQRRPGRDLVGLADHLGVHPAHRLHDVRAGLGLPDLRRHLLVGGEDGRARRRLLHRLAQPDRPARGHRLGRVRRRHLPRPHDQHGQQRLRRRVLADPRVHPVRGHPGARGDGQHLQRTSTGDRQQHLGVVARRRCRDRDPGPDRGPRHPPEHRLRVHRADQQLRLQQRGLLVPGAAARASCSRSTRSPASTPPPTCRRRPRERPKVPRRASGARSSTPPSAATSCCSRSSSPFRTPPGCPTGGGARRRDLRPGAAPRAGTSWCC